MRVVIRGNWSDCVGTDYCEALGVYPDLRAAKREAQDFAWERWEPQESEDEAGVEDEGPEYCVEEYDPDVHDMHRVGDGSFAEDFERMEK